mmetsp:Transcript_29268/g.46721  ORF Transcript_29268/g.46721 Transcript_29268/m.46721 type:complete len:210 (-) Transcript_29268:836-1465(-)
MASVSLLSRSLLASIMVSSCGTESLFFVVSSADTSNSSVVFFDPVWVSSVEFERPPSPSLSSVDNDFSEISEDSSKLFEGDSSKLSEGDSSKLSEDFSKIPVEFPTLDSVAVEFEVSFTVSVSVSVPASIPVSISVSVSALAFCFDDFPEVEILVWDGVESSFTSAFGFGVDVDETFADFLIVESPVELKPRSRDSIRSMVSSVTTALV